MHQSSLSCPFGLLDVAGLRLRRAVLALAAPLLGALATLGAGSCQSNVTVLPDASGGCSADEDCPLGEICSIGACLPGCRPGDDHCPPGQVCVGGTCKPALDGGAEAGTDGGDGGDGGPIECPTDDMVNVDDLFCIDRYEASRSDATDQDHGTNESMATSRPHVLPWLISDKSTAEYACQAAGKRLCLPNEFEFACRGPEGTSYSYGDSYEPTICNSIDTYCHCGGAACDGIEPCPYPHCFNAPPTGQSSPPYGCGSGYQLEPTASFPDCHSSFGVYDINGNVWELTEDGTAEGLYRGGAYNCINSEALHRCDYGTKSIIAKGFRCCWSP